MRQQAQLACLTACGLRRKTMSVLLNCSFNCVGLSPIISDRQWALLMPVFFSTGRKKCAHSLILFSLRLSSQQAWRWQLRSPSWPQQPLFSISLSNSETTVVYNFIKKGKKKPQFFLNGGFSELQLSNCFGGLN